MDQRSRLDVFFVNFMVSITAGTKGNESLLGRGINFTLGEEKAVHTDNYRIFFLFCQVRGKRHNSLALREILSI
jgi:hypothetical protein